MLKGTGKVPVVMRRKEKVEEQPQAEKRKVGEEDQPSAEQQGQDPEVPPAQRVKKPRRPQGVSVPLLSDEQEEEAIQFFRNHEVLYNRRHLQYRDVDHRDSLWQEQAGRLGISADELRVWWDGLRSRYVNLTKPGQSGSRAVTVTARQRWIVQNLSFLDKFIARKHCTLSAVSVATLAPDRPVPSRPAPDTEVQDVVPEPAKDCNDGPSTSQTAAQKALGQMFLGLNSKINPQLYRQFFSESMAFMQRWQYQNWNFEHQQQQNLVQTTAQQQLFHAQVPSSAQQEVQSPPLAQQQVQQLQQPDDDWTPGLDAINAIIY